MSSHARKGHTDLAILSVAAGGAVFGALIILGSRSELLLIAAPLGAVALVLAARRPLLALSIMVAIEFTNLSGLLAERSGIPVFQASLLMGLVAIGLALREPQYRNRLNGWTVVSAGLLAVYLATQAIALIGSVDPAASAAMLQRHVVDCVFVMVVLVLIQLTAQPWTVAAVIVVTLAALCSLTIISQVFFGGSATFGGLSTVTEASGELVTTLRFGGPLPDSNFWGRHLVMGLPMAAALLTRALRGGRASTVAVWGSSLVLLLGGIYLTQSRGTFLAAGIAIAVWFVAVESRVRRWALILIPSSVAVLLVPGIGNRLVITLEDFLQADVQTNIDLSVAQRLAAQEEAWAMFGERPVFGFGPGTFPGQVINFAGRVPTAVREPTNAPHNLYAELAAEGGWVGLIGWAVVILGFLAMVVLGILTNPLSRDRVLAAAVCAALVAWSVASIALHMAYFRTFGVVLALAGGLAPAWPAAADAVRQLINGALTWCAAGLVGLGAGWAVLSASGSEAVTVRQPMTVVPAGALDGWYAYALDIRSRVELLPTVATLMDQAAAPVDIIADPVRGVLVFTTTADSVERASDEIRLAVADAETTLRSSIGYQQYSLQTVGSMRVFVVQQRSPVATLAAVAVGASATLLAAWGLRRAVRRRPEAPPERAHLQEASSVP